MAGRHLRDLFTAYGERDDLRFRRAAQALIQEEEQKRHTVLAKELRGLLAANSGLGVNEAWEPLADVPVDRDSSLPLARLSNSDRYLSDLVLAPSAERQLVNLVSEIRHWPALDAAGLPRRNRLLLSGPPGCGKTSAVESLAGDLGRTLVTARVEGLISSYLGETAANLSNLFTFASSGPFVLFLDEFDSLGKARDDPSDHGELRRVVNAVLQQIDQYRGPALIVAATNHSHILDTALWRRFDTVVELALPSQEEIAKLLSRLLPRLTSTSNAAVAQQLVGKPHAAVEYLAHAARRSAVVAGRRSPSDQDVSEGLEQVTSRPWM